MNVRLNDTDAICGLIARVKSGEQEALAELVAETYQDLRRLARGRLYGHVRPADIDTTSLVNEWYIRFVQAKGVDIQDRAHFMRYAAAVMRSVIVDEVRHRKAVRRGGDVVHEPLTIQLAEQASSSGEDDILRVHEALAELERLDARMAAVVEMRYFAGMSEAEIAEALDVSDRTVRRYWVKARLLLAEALAE